MAEPLSSFTGVSSGMDWKGLVESIIALDKRPVDKLQARIDANTSRSTALDQFRTAMAALKTAADGLAGGSALDLFSVTTDGADAAGRMVLSAVASVGASAGSYALQVTSLATAQKRVGTAAWSATQKAGPDDAATVGTLTVGGQPVTVRGGDTLATIRDRINTATGKSGVQATILSLKADGSDQRLVLTGTKTGAGNAWSVADDTAGSLVAALGIGGADLTGAADAAFTIDGSDPITRPTNTVGDVLPGVTLNLTAAGSATVTVARQASASSAAMQAFVDAYNKVVDFVKVQGTAKAPLQGEPMLRVTPQQLSGLMLGAAATGNAGGVAEDLTRLVGLGVSLQKDGKLAFSAATFQAAYPAREADVKALLADRMQAFSTFADSVTGSFTGAIDRRKGSLSTQSATMQARMDDINARLDKKRAMLLAQYAKFEGSLGKIKSVGDSMSAQFTAMINSMGSR
jgi:flagellar hook-associated protein 2